MKKFDHATITLRADASPGSEVVSEGPDLDMASNYGERYALDAAGDEGYELVTVILDPLGNKILYLKREHRVPSAV
ncbi:hypothetical protein AB0L40_04305 [Patulibacter sp. NPDC049589]|uniref:hypothetical protein n=1 Tax=Patulibacter sp. NPDC049589 TaxID=3154731 RepID=UPI0034121D1A